MSNFVRSFLFRPSLNFVELMVLIYVTVRFQFWIAMLLYCLFIWFVEPIIRSLVGATPADLAKIDSDNNSNKL